MVRLKQMERKKLIWACSIITLLAVVGIVTVIISMGGKHTPSSPSAAETVLQGTLTCLPHKNTAPGQPTTLECAIGLKTSDGKYYGLQNLPADAASTPFTQHVTVTGDSMLPEASNIYDVTAIVAVKKFVTD